MVKRILYLIAAAMVFIGCVLFNQREKAVSAACRMPTHTLVIDAGHGGEDGGAVAVSGTPESQINLAIAKKTDALCGLFGVSVVMVRDSDLSLADDSADTLREKKRSDLMNRVNLVNGTDNAVLLSIHQNNFSNSSSKGAQVFYHDDPTSEDWAKQMQKLLSATLDESNHRKATQIPGSVYLMNHVSCRAVLVECGFLSHPQEDVLLESDPYQTKLAAVLTASYLTYNEATS